MLRRQLLRVAQHTARPAVRVPITGRIRPFSLSAQFRAEQPESPVDPRDPQITELKVPNIPLVLVSVGLLAGENGEIKSRFEDPRGTE